MLIQADFHHIVRQEAINYNINASKTLTKNHAPDASRIPYNFFYQKYFLILLIHFAPN